MTEADWLSFTSVTQPIFRMLRRRASQRKLYLAAAAAVRQVWQWLGPVSRDAIEVLERHVDGLATEDEMHTAYDAALGAAFGLGSALQSGAVPGRDDWKRSYAAMAASYGVTTPAGPSVGTVDPWLAAYNAFFNAAKTGKRAETWRVQAIILRDIFGNPFRPVAVDARWLTWNDGTVVKLAQAIYDDRDLPSGYLDAGRLAILADALVECGCANEEILAHCRHAGFHSRGCWLVDALAKDDPPVAC